MTVAGSFFLAVVVVCVLPARAARDNCTAGFMHDIFATAQEMVLLIVAFTIGWHLIGPFLGIVFRQSRAVTFCATAARGNPRASGLPPQEPAPAEPASGPASAEPRQAISFPSGRPDVGVDLWISLANAAEGASLPQPAAYADIFEACIQSGDFQSAQRLARRAAWTVPGGPKGPSLLLALARWLARRQNITDAEKCLQKVRDSGNRVDLRSVRAIIVVCAQLGRMDMGSVLFEKLADDTLKPDFAIYSAMIRGLCNVGQVEDALAYVQRMRSDGVNLDAMLFDVLFEGCVHQNHFKGAERLLAQMKDLGMQPSNATLAACIRLYSSRGELKRAMAMFEEMTREYHLQPNAYVYGALVAACVRCSKPELALAMHERMVAVGCSPNGRVYELLIRCCIQLGWTAKAVELLDAALGLRTAESPTAQVMPRTRTFIDPRVVEDLLLLLARRKQASSLGLPLLKRLEEADFEIPERAAALAAAAEAEHAESDGPGSRSSGPGDVRGGRRRDFDQWRNFAAVG